ncbi:MAG TPA: hypothetical protein VLA13_05105 [Massilibacterium sp.]|nr:hypothetical protein [Massilibacterium sp.]
MSETTAIVTIFESPTLNEVGASLITNYKGFHENQQLAKEYLNKAICRRFMSGKLLSTYHDEIMEECGSQRAFGEKIGLSESIISNDRRAYEALAERGADTPEKMLKLLQEKRIKSNIYEWERLPKFLNEPDAYREPDRRKKDEKRLEDLEKEVTEIRQRNESANNNHIATLASDSIKEIGELKDHLSKLDPFSYQWKNRQFIDWAKSLGWDFINDEPCENLEFHHTDMQGGSGGVGKKLPDVFGLPTSIKTHYAIEQGAYKPRPEQLASGLIKLHALFIMNHWK